MNTVLVFDLWGDLGHFRKPYTTTSPLTFAFPPRPTLAGIISAIIGLGKNEYADYFSKKDANIGLRILKPVKKIRMSQNLIDTKKAKLFSRIKQRTQIRFEYAKDPRYRIYFQHKDTALHERLKALLINHESIYTVSLGLSELLANFRYVGEFGLQRVASNNSTTIHSVIPDKGTEVEFEQGKEYFSTNIPLEMNSSRIVTQFGTVLYERNGKPLLAQTEFYFKVENGERILFL
jgi:CRISPR-associated protein Cas5h